MAFVSAVDAACLRLLKSNTEDANKLFLEASRMELEFFTSVDASVLAPLSQELYSFYSQIPATVPAAHRPHSQSLSAGAATSLMKKINHVVGSRKDDVTEPLLHTLAGCVLLAARRHPASLQNVFRLLFGLHRNPKLISCACGDAMTCRLRPQIEGIFGDCLEVMGMEAFLQHVYLNVGRRRRTLHCRTRRTTSCSACSRRAWRRSRARCNCSLTRVCESEVSASGSCRW